MHFAVNRFAQVNGKKTKIYATILSVQKSMRRLMDFKISCDKLQLCEHELRLKGQKNQHE